MPGPAVESRVNARTPDLTPRETGAAELRRARRAGLGLLGAVFLFSIFVNLLMLTGPLFMLQVYDRVLVSHSEETLVALFALVTLLYALMGVLEFARGRVLARFGARFETALDHRVFDAVVQAMGLSQAAPHAHTAGASRAPAQIAGLRDLDGLRMVFVSPVMLALFDVPWTPLFVAAIFMFHPMLGWLGILGGAVLIALTLLNNALTRRRVAQAQRRALTAQSLSDQAAREHEILRAQGMQGTVRSRWVQMRQEALLQTIAASDWTGAFTAATRALRMFLQSAVLALGAWLVLRGELSAGAMVACSILLGRALAPIEQVIVHWSTVQQARAGWRHLSKLLRTVPPDPERLNLPDPTGQLEVRSLALVLPGARRASLSGITFSVAPGEALGILGKSGAGKSLLGRMLVGLIPPTAGEICLDGAPLSQYAPAALGRHIGYLPQQVSLFAGTVAENIARMEETFEDSAVVTAARRANAHDMILSLPEGYDTRIGPGAAQLSGGQQQRIALARAFFGDPALLVLDEPNSALDSAGSDALNAAVRDFKALGRSVILMTHRPMAISECDRLLILESGHVRAEGPRDEVLRANLRNAVQVQAGLAGGGQAG